MTVVMRTMMMTLMTATMMTSMIMNAMITMMMMMTMTMTMTLVLEDDVDNDDDYNGDDDFIIQESEPRFWTRDLRASISWMQLLLRTSSSFLLEMENISNALHQINDRTP